MNGAGALAKPDFATVRYNGNVLDAQRSAGLGCEDGVFDVANSFDQPDFANIDLLQAGLDETAAGVGIVAGELLLDLREAQSIGDQLIRINANLVFASRSTETGDINDVRDRLEIFLDHPVFDGFQFHHVVVRIGAFQREKIDL